MGKVRKDRTGRFYIEFPGKLRIFVNKQHENFHSQHEAERCMHKIQGEIENGTFDPGFYSVNKRSIHSFSSFADKWLENCQLKAERDELAPEYVRRLKSRIENHMKPFFGEQNMQDINEGRLEDFYLQLPGCAESRRNIMGTLHKMFVDARRRRTIQVIPLFPELGKLPKREVPWAT